MDAIFKRRSVRNYTDKEVSEDQLRVILEAAQCAPHAGSVPSWYFYVVQDKKLLNALSVMTDYTTLIKDISALIVVCGDLTISGAEQFWVQECSAATMNILTIVEEMGLGAVWLGVYPIMDDVTYVKNNLGIPQHLMPLNMIPIGYPKKHPESKIRFKEECVHKVIWDDVHGMDPFGKRRKKE